MKKILIVLSVFLISPLPLLAQVMMVEILPNTTDDANLEYIDIVNTGCESIDMGWYTLSDKVKSYVLPSPSVLESQMTYRVARPISRIELNNTNEELSLHDAGWVLLDSFTYATSTKWDVITILWTTFDDCLVDDAQDDVGGSTGDTITEEDTTETDGTGDTGVGNESEEAGSGSVDETWTGSITDDTSTDTSTGTIDDGMDEDTPPGEDQEVPEGGDQTGSGGTDVWSDDSSGGQWYEDSENDAIQTSDLLGQSGSLAPQILLYSDSDGDGYIDILEVLYDVYITGSVDADKILLYSNTWWLYETRVNTQTWYILDAEIEDNILRLFIEPSHYEKNTLTHNSTTTSDIRLKSSGGFGITSLSGELVGDFLLTTSFDAYKEVYARSAYETLWQEDATWAILSDSWGILEVVFPEIVPTIQNYTNTTLSGNTFVCRETPCRINLNFESIFTSIYPSSSYTCQVSYNWVTEDKCNPSQWTPTTRWGFDVFITHKATGQSVSRYFSIDWDIVTTTSTTNPYIPTSDQYPPIVFIKLNGTLTKKQIQIRDNELYCYTSTCALNFDGTGTYDPDGASMTYSWTDNGVVFATRKNPSIRDFSLGEHTVLFTATDASGKMTTEEYRVTVFGEMDIPDAIQTEFASTTITKSKTKSTKKLKPVQFFSPPELTVEKSSVPLSLKNGGYQCVTTAATCSINFALSWALSGIQYKIWYDSDMDPTWTTNPRSKAFVSWKHTLTLTAHYTREGAAIWQQVIPIEVIRVKKAAVAKKITTKTPAKATVSSKMEIIPTTYAADGSTTESRWDSIIYVLFLSVLLNVFFLRRRYTKTV